MTLDEMILKCKRQQEKADCPDAAVFLGMDNTIFPKAPTIGQEVEVWTDGPKGTVFDYDVIGRRSISLVFAADELLAGLEALRRVRNG